MLRKRKIRSVARTILNRLGAKKSISYFDGQQFLNYVQKKKCGLVKRSNEINTLVLGSSHADFGFYDREGEGGYNLGLSSADLYTAYHLYKGMQGSLSHLENVVIFFSVFSLGFSLIKTNEKYRCTSYRHFFDIPYQDSSLIRPEIDKEIRVHCNELPPLGIDPNYWGYEKKPYFHAPAEDRAATHLRENARVPDQMEWLEKTLSTAQITGHRVYIVIPPARSDYKRVLHRRTELFEKLYAINLGGHRIIDFYSSALFDDDCMGDPDHMNKFGAIKLTHELMNIIHGDAH